jgi:heme A synthase
MRMIFGTPVQPSWLLTLGILLLVLLVFQILVGMRKIKFGRKTFVYHRWVAFTILGLAVVHGLLGMLFAYGWSVF